MVELNHVVAAAGEVNALIEAAQAEAHEHDEDYHAHCDEALTACAEEVEVGVGKHLARERCGEGESLEGLGLLEDDKHEAGKIYRCEE